MPSISVRGWTAPSLYVFLASLELSFWLATLLSGCIAGSPEFRKMLWGLPPIHFGKEDGVERTLLRVACQSETFLASPWQGGAILHASVAHCLPK